MWPIVIFQDFVAATLNCYVGLSRVLKVTRYLVLVLEKQKTFTGNRKCLEEKIQTNFDITWLSFRHTIFSFFFRL